MSASPDIAASLPDRIQLAASFDAAALQKEVRLIISELNQQHYIYYSVLVLGGPVENPPEFDWTSCSLLKGCAYINSMLKSFQTEITSARLMRLEPGAVIKEHTDPTLDARHREVLRLTIPVFSTDDVTFYLNQVPVPMQPGEMWYLRLSDPHSVHHLGKSERINMAIDVVYNDWLEDQLAACAASA